MRKLFYSLTALVAAMTVNAAPIDRQQALQNAQAYLYAQPTHRAKASHGLTMAYESMAKNATTDTRNANFYVFNIDEGNGFIIVSGDDRTEAVLGYSDNGQFDADKMPDNLRWWLSCYDEQIEWVRANVAEKRTAPSRSSTEVIKPLMTTKWDQGSPYNYHCPTINGTACPTGCLATALAQIMNYHKWPQTATKSLPQYSYWDYSRTIEALPATVFDWDHMLDRYSENMIVNGIATPEVEAVSKLMRYCGQIVHMVYGLDGSGSSEDYLIPDALSYYFGYADTCWGSQRQNYSIGEWEELILNELRNNRPVLYCGYTSSYEGHAFVCEGYNGEGLFYINWGWSGYADGPFRLSVLDASYSGIGGSQTSNQFSVNQIAYFGIQPTGTDTENHYSDRLTVTERPSVEKRILARANSNANFYVNLYMPVTNNTGGNYSRSNGFGYALYQNGEEVKRLKQINAAFGFEATYRDETPLTFGADLADGDYEIYAVSQNRQTKAWEKDDGSDRNYLKLHLENNTLTMTPMPLGAFTVNDVTQKKNAVVVNFTNEGEEYNGPIYLQDCDQNIVSWEQAAIAAGETTDIAFYIPDGSTFDIYEVYYLTTDHFKDNWFYTNARLDGSDLTKTVKIINQSDDGKVYGSKALCQIDVTNHGTGIYMHSISTEMRNTANDNTSTIAKSIYTIPAGETIQLYYEIPITKTQRGSTFELSSTHSKADGTKVADNVTFTPVNGATMWDGKGNVSTAAQQSTFAVPDGVAAADVATAFTKDATANSNPNTLYLLDTSVPSGLKGKNVLNNKMTTANIHLYDGYEYYIPSNTSTSKSMNYHRTINEANSWSTMALPFAPTQVTADGSAVEWQKSDADTGKSLYIMTLAEVQGDKLIFSFTDELEANTPYIIAVGSELVGKELLFSAGPTSLRPTRLTTMTAEANNYVLTGVNTATAVDGAYLINGNYATPANGQAVDPFRAYLSAEGGIGYATMTIVTGIELSGIHDIHTETTTTGVVYTLAGQRIGTAHQLQTLPKGIYIVDGKKVTVK